MIGNKFKGLGKGLSALMGDVPPENIQIKSSSEKIPIHFVYPNPSQPRKNFNQELLSELSESIKEQGIIQPILVRKKSDDKYCAGTIAYNQFVDEFLSRENLEEKKVA